MCVYNKSPGQLHRKQKVTRFCNVTRFETYNSCRERICTCAWPLQASFKTANPLLEERVPEAYEYFESFAMSTEEINAVTSYFLEIRDSSEYYYTDSTEQWLMAACQWLTSTDEPTNEPTNAPTMSPTSSTAPLSAQMLFVFAMIVILQM